VTAQPKGSWGLGLIACALACASPPPDPERYRLQDSGSHWDVAPGDDVLHDLLPRYPDYFDVILDPLQQQLPKMIQLRDDLEREPVDRRNFDALNSLAIGYFEINYRAESHRGDGLVYLSESQRAAKLLAVPWRGYAETDHAPLRNAILDFFEDAAHGEKLATAATAGRIAPIVGSLARKEHDPARHSRISRIVDEIEARQADTMEPSR
jgi:hypothetical protein